MQFSDDLVQSRTMRKKQNGKSKAADKPGPKPELYKIEGMSWQDAVKKSFTKKKPAGGWPK